MLVELAAPWHDVMRRLDLPLPPPPARCRRRARGTCSSRSRAQVPEPSIAETAVAESYYGAEKGHGGAARRRGTPSSRSHLHPRAQGRRGHAGLLGHLRRAPAPPRRAAPDRRPCGRGGARRLLRGRHAAARRGHERQPAHAQRARAAARRRDARGRGHRGRLERRARRGGRRRRGRRARQRGAQPDGVVSPGRGGGGAVGGHGHQTLGQLHPRLVVVL
mmetsp:Transcript_37512/g.95257  ORF Transcript_37512/g.95257 Transcript_37512/m.95257 type:complete len:219 (-) Transcript_37512:115-771(-)